ncbi:DnaD domain-containing protein [uncultured Megasphaera sp.]|uniref:DnaD domain-containing protein n=1 Tax=uncultured Megasphaera sp. TaxID=165188 RepID=UPI00258E31FA|nr:DnaD domain protein [uncultured Megasphaera sp.]
MADKRMMSKSVIDTDVFIDMPISTQCLYFHMLLRADDDGFLKNAKTIMRTVGASPDDVKLLIAKQYLIPFDTGIMAIKHWRIHNYIKKDRYKPTDCEEIKLLEVNEKGEYVLAEPDCIQSGTKVEPDCIQSGTKVEPKWNQNGTKMEPQVRDRDRDRDRLEIEIGKDRDKEEEKEERHFDDDEKKKILTTYQKEIHPVLSSSEYGKLYDLIDEYGAVRVLQAIERAVLRGKRSIGYINGILDKWRRDGYDEPDAARSTHSTSGTRSASKEELDNIAF